MGSEHRISHQWWHSVTRRQFLGAAAATAGVLATGLRIPNVLGDTDELATVLPNPIPGTFPVVFKNPDQTVLVHHFPTPVPNDSLPIGEPSEITDFNGVVGLCRVKGSGTGSTGLLNYQVDNGYMSGLYRGVDGLMHHGTFAFI